MGDYFGLLPGELITEILYYLDTNEIRNLKSAGIDSIQFNQAIGNKYFWINKAKNEGADPRFLEYLSLVELNDITSRGYQTKRGDYLTAYNKLFNLLSDVGPIVEALEHYNGSSLTIHLNHGTNIKDLIATYDLRTFDGMINMNDGVKCDIWWDRGTFHYNCGHYDDTKLSTESGTLYSSDVIFLLIKLELLGYDTISDFSDLDEYLTLYTQ